MAEEALAGWSTLAKVLASAWSKLTVAAMRLQSVVSKTESARMHGWPRLQVDGEDDDDEEGVQEPHVDVEQRERVEHRGADDGEDEELRRRLLQVAEGQEG